MADKKKRIRDLEARVDAQALEIERIHKRLEQLELDPKSREPADATEQH